jgi:hypothetical protein
LERASRLRCGDDSLGRCDFSKLCYQWYVSISHLAIFISVPSAEFPWKELGDNASVCDVGGGIGNITLQLAKAYVGSHIAR